MSQQTSKRKEWFDERDSSAEGDERAGHDEIKKLLMKRRGGSRERRRQAAINQKIADGIIKPDDIAATKSSAMQGSWFVRGQLYEMSQEDRIVTMQRDTPKEPTLRSRQDNRFVSIRRNAEKGIPTKKSQLRRRETDEERQYGRGPRVQLRPARDNMAEWASRRNLPEGFQAQRSESTSSASPLPDSRRSMTSYNQSDLASPSSDTWRSSQRSFDSIDEQEEMRNDDLYETLHPVYDDKGHYIGYKKVVLEKEDVVIDVDEEIPLGEDEAKLERRKRRFSDANPTQQSGAAASSSAAPPSDSQSSLAVPNVPDGDGIETETFSQCGKFTVPVLKVRTDLAGWHCDKCKESWNAGGPSLDKLPRVGGLPQHCGQALWHGPIIAEVPKRIANMQKAQEHRAATPIATSPASTTPVAKAHLKMLPRAKASESRFPGRSRSWSPKRVSFDQHSAPLGDRHRYDAVRRPEGEPTPKRPKYDMNSDYRRQDDLRIARIAKEQEEPSYHTSEGSKEVRDKKREAWLQLQEKQRLAAYNRGDGEQASKDAEKMIKSRSGKHFSVIAKEANQSHIRKGGYQQTDENPRPPGFGPMQPPPTNAKPGLVKFSIKELMKQPMDPRPPPLDKDKKGSRANAWVPKLEVAVGGDAGKGKPYLQDRRQTGQSSSSSKGTPARDSGYERKFTDEKARKWTRVAVDWNGTANSFIDKWGTYCVVEDGTFPLPNVASWRKLRESNLVPFLASYIGIGGQYSTERRNCIRNARQHLCSCLGESDYDPGHPTIEGVHCVIVDEKTWNWRKRSGGKPPTIRMPEYNAYVLIDDNAQICEEAEAAGITCIQVRTGSRKQDLWWSNNAKHTFGYASSFADAVTLITETISYREFQEVLYSVWEERTWTPPQVDLTVQQKALQDENQQGASRSRGSQ